MKSRFTRFAFGFSFCAVIAYAVVTITGSHGIHALREKQALIREMQQRNAKEAQRIERIKEHIERLDDNPAEQELEIRERLKLVRRDEKVFITGQPQKR